MSEFLQDPVRWSLALLVLAFLVTALVTGITCGVALTIEVINNFPRLGAKND